MVVVLRRGPRGDARLDERRCRDALWESRELLAGRARRAVDVRDRPRIRSFLDRQRAHAVLAGRRWSGIRIWRTRIRTAGAISISARWRWVAALSGFTAR